MNPRKCIPTTALTLAALLLTATLAGTVYGQQRIFQPRNPNRQPVNPRHEQLKTQADQAYRQGDYAEVVKLTNTVLQQNPRDAVAYYLRGSARVEIGLRNRDAKEMRSGISDAREAIRLDSSGNPMYYLPYLYGMTNLAALEDRKEHAEVAVKYAGQLLKQSSLNGEMRANIHYQRGNAHMTLEQYDKAVSDFLSAIKHFRTHLGAHLAAADAYSRAGQPEKAEEQYTTAVSTFSDNPLVYNNRGMFYQQQGEYKKAVADFTRAIELNREYRYAYTNRGFSLLAMGQPDAAEADFTKSLSLNSRQPAVHGLRATARVAQGNIDGALKDNRAAIRLAPQDPSAHADLGFTLFFAGKYDEANNAFEQSLKFNKPQQHLEPWRFLALQKTGNNDDAQALVKPAVEKQPDNRNWVETVLAYLDGKLTDEELVDAAGKKLKEAKPAQLCEAHYFIGLQQQQAGNTKPAMQHFQKAVETDQRHLSAFQGAQLALRQLKNGS